MIPKFRAWDNKSRIMHHPDELIIQIKGQDVFVVLKDSLHQIQDYRIMQSTGLYDKYHNEVFAGDILYDDHNCEYGVVKIEEAQAIVDWGSYISPLFEDVDTLEVVGNIYENADLLEEER